jgi:hypothetical protein
MSSLRAIFGGGHHFPTQSLTASGRNGRLMRVTSRERGMAYRGHIEGNIVVFDDKVSLPEGTIVSVEPVEAARLMTLAERHKDIIGIAPDLPCDMADNHDHYIHGTPRK